MNRTTKVAVALIVAAGLSTMVYALPEQRAMAHPRLHLLSPDSYPDDLPFGPNSPDPTVSASKSDPPPDPPDPDDNGGGNGGGNNGTNCVGCITTQNLADGAVTTPKIAPGAVSINTTTTQVVGPIVAIPVMKTGLARVDCPSGTVATGGGFKASGPEELDESIPLGGAPPTAWAIIAHNPTASSVNIQAFAVCSTTHP